MKPELRLVSGTPRGIPREPEGERHAPDVVAAFGALAGPHLDALYTMCVRLVRDPAVAEDLAQETLVRFLQQPERFDPSRPMRPWLLKVGLNACRDHLRTVWWQRVLSLDFYGDAGDASPFTPRAEDRVDPEAGLDAARRDHQVRAALATLPPKYREAVTLFHLEGMSYAEMSEITDVNVAALKQRVRRGCGMLRDAVERMYPELHPDRT